MTIRDALDSYPFSAWLKRGPMDLRPSLATHLAEHLDIPQPRPNEAVGQILSDILAIADHWTVTAAQMESGSSDARAIAATMRGCAQEIKSLVEDV